jgi:hypothetical protein
VEAPGGENFNSPKWVWAASELKAGLSPLNHLPPAVLAVNEQIAAAQNRGKIRLAVNRRDRFATGQKIVVIVTIGNELSTSIVALNRVSNSWNGNLQGGRPSHGRGASADHRETSNQK